MRIIQNFGAACAACLMLFQVARADPLIVNDSGFLAVANNALWVATSAPGDPTERAQLPQGQTPKFLAAGGGRYLAYSPLGFGWAQSSDGIHWSSVAANGDSPMHTVQIRANPEALAFADGRFFTALFDGSLCSTADGNQWTCADKIPQVGEAMSMMTCGQNLAIMFHTKRQTPGGNIEGEAIGFSPDGKTWTYAATTFVTVKHACVDGAIVSLKSNFGSTVVQFITHRPNGQVTESNTLKQSVFAIGGGAGKILAIGTTVSWPPRNVVDISTDGGRTFHSTASQSSDGIEALVCNPSRCIAQAHGSGASIFSTALRESKDGVHWKPMQ